MEPYIFSKTFGEKYHPAIVLHAGAGCQSITWPDVFCENLSEMGYFVIRYDYRDTGLSSAIVYDTDPYDVMDMARDVIRMLETHGVQDAHMIGYSMGGKIAQFIAAHFPTVVKNLVLIGSSTDFTVGFDAFDGKRDPSKLPPPSQDYVNWIMRSLRTLKKNVEDRVQEYVKTWKLLDGNPSEFSDDFFYAQGVENYTRSKLHKGYISHVKAMKASAILHQEVPSKILKKTLILHGGKDIVFSVAHAEDLHKKIKDSELLVIEDFGHAISPQHFDRLLETIHRFIKNNDKNFIKQGVPC